MSFPTIPLLLAGAWASTCAPSSASADIAVESKVLDGATGKAIPAFVEQRGRVDPKDPSRIIWGESEGRIEKANVDGSFRTGVDWAGGRRIRILAPGYAPRDVLAGPPPVGAKEVEVIVYLTRGREVSGTIRDAEGKPVAEAAVFLVGQREVNVSGGKAFLEHTAAEDRTVTRSISAHDGRFAIAGAEDEDRLVISAPGLDFWVIPLPIDPNAPCEVRLPEPARLTIRYDTPGAPDEGGIRLHLLTGEIPGWKSIGHIREARQRNGTTRTLDNLAPGEYSICRRKDATIGDVVYGGFIDHQRVTIRPGGSAEAVFARDRDRGAAITGTVDWPGREGSFGAFVAVQKGKGKRNSFVPELDATKTGPDGTFTTETLPPGDYTIAVEAPVPIRNDGPIHLSLGTPRYVGTARVTIPAEGKPKPVTITLDWPSKAKAK